MLTWSLRLVRIQHVTQDPIEMRVDVLLCMYLFNMFFYLCIFYTCSFINVFLTHVYFTYFKLLLRYKIVYFCKFLPCLDLTAQGLQQNLQNGTTFWDEMFVNSFMVNIYNFMGEIVGFNYQTLEGPLNTAVSVELRMSPYMIECISHYI